MGTVDISGAQKQILTALVNKYQQADAPVKGGQIAEVVDRAPGTVRNQMLSLRSLDLAEGISGRKGGYVPTENAFAVLDRDDLDEQATVPLSHEYDRIDATVDEISFPNVVHPTECTARVHLQQSEPSIAVGDPLVVGPTPNAHLAVLGEVEVVNDTADEFLLDVTGMEAPLAEE